MSSAMQISAAAAIYLLVLLGEFSEAQAQGAAEQQLTGGTSREWVFKRVVKSMGPGNSCSSGETYTFAADQSLTTKICQKGQLDTKRFSWRLSENGAGDSTLVVEGLGSFLVLFRNPPNGSHLMRLRTRGQSPTQPTTDKEFRLNED
jgi:hypothetical protein